MKKFDIDKKLAFMLIMAFLVGVVLTYALILVKNQPLRSKASSYCEDFNQSLAHLTNITSSDESGRDATLASLRQAFDSECGGAYWPWYMPEETPQS